MDPVSPSPEHASVRVSRLYEERTKARVEAGRLAAEQGLNPAKRIQAEAAAMLPATRALTDPADREVQAFQHELVRLELADKPNMGHILAPDERPELRTAVENYTETLNRMHGVDYPPPLIVIADGYKFMQRQSAVYLAEEHAILIDKTTLSQIEDNPEALNALVGHELEHRYQRSDASITAALEASLARRNPDGPVANAATTDLTLRRDELEADFRAAQLTSPAAVKGMLNDIVTVSNYVEMQHISERDGRDFGDVLENGTFAEFDKAASEIAAMPEADQAALRDRMLKDDDARSTKTDHPSLIERDRFMEMLSADPKLMQTCVALKFEGSSTLPDMEACGPSSTPQAAQQDTSRSR